jgi:myo-inositol-1(or 4)-monophosphatase
VDAAAILSRIDAGLRRAGEILLQLRTENLAVERKAERNDPVTEADLRVDAVLRETLPREGEGWLSEETADDASRLQCEAVWVVDPLDGTREYIADIPEWCVSIGYVVNGEAVAGGIFNPVTDQRIVGAVGHGVTLNDQPAKVSDRQQLDGALVVGSRSEFRRGEWDRFQDVSLRLQPTGSVAYKLGLVAAGLVDATWTLVPKSEWDVAAGIALVRAAGGAVRLPGGEMPVLNQPRPKLPGLIATSEVLMPQVWDLLGSAEKR